MARKSKSDRNQELLAEVRKRYELAVGAEAENRRLFSEDLRFVYQDTIEADGQWDSAVLLMRRGRPSYTFNRVIGAVNLVLGDQRQTRPQARVRAANKDASVSIANIYGGLIRDIEQCSGAESIYDNQFKNAVAGGYGAWRIVPEYEDDKSFSQVLRIKDIPNPLTVLWDPEATDPCKGDSMWCIVAERISREKYEALYPDFDPVNIIMSRDSRGWATDNEIRIAEYFRKIPKKKIIAEMSDGSIIEWTPEQQQIEDVLAETLPDGNYVKAVRKRTIKTWAVEWYLVDGANVLSGPITYDWKRIPVIRCPGRCVNIEGKQKTQSLVRHTKDPQRTYNYHRSTMVEIAALTPRAPYIATPKMVKGYEDMWATANTNARPYLLYDPDPDVPGGRPTREPPPDVPEALVALAKADLEDIQAATGYFDASLGATAEQGDRTSGKALIARQRKSDLGSYEFIDNFGKAMKLSHECMIDMIPTVYDTERVVRVIGPDGVEKYEEINKIDPNDPNGLVNSLKDGSYDVSVTIGPSYQTARQEMLATLLDAVDVIPQLAQTAPDLITKNIDTPDVDELVRRLRIPLIQQGVVQPTEEEKKNLPPPPQPDPMQQAALKDLEASARKSAATAAQIELKNQDHPLNHALLANKALKERLDAIVTAREHGVKMQGAQAEQQQAIQQSNQMHSQGMIQRQQQAQQAMEIKAKQEQQAREAAAQEAAMEHVAHIQSIAHEQSRHAQKLRQSEELHKKKLQQRKEEAAKKPKSK